MKTIILAGGFGTRLQEETVSVPKPMVTIGDQPIISHIMHIYSACGFSEFVVALGYRGEMIKEYFLNRYLLGADLEIDLATGRNTRVHEEAIDWKVELVDTGLRTMTGGRLRRLRDRLENETFMMTYGDGLADLDINALVSFHRSSGTLATVTAVHPPSRFGALQLNDDGIVIEFSEKPKHALDWINGGFFVLEPGVFDYLSGDDDVWEREALEHLAKDGQLAAFRHEGFWQPMDTMRERNYLDELWASGHPPWKIW